MSAPQTIDSLSAIIKSQQAYISQLEQKLYKESGFFPEKKLNSLEDCVLDYCANINGITRSMMMSKSQERPCINARQMAFYVLRYELKYSLKKIARLFGKDHSTVISGINTLKDHIDTEADTKEMVSQAVDFTIKAKLELIQKLNQTTN